MNIKAACTQGVSRYKRRDLMALMKLYEKLLISIKKSNIVINVEHIYMLLWKKKTEDSEFDSESNDVKVPSLQIVARADCTRVKLINGVPRRFRPNWIIVRVYASCLQIRSSVVRHRPEARVWVVAYSGLYESSRSKEKNKEETRKKGAARTHLEVNHPESNRLRYRRWFTTNS